MTFAAGFLVGIVATIFVLAVGVGIALYAEGFKH